MPITSTSAILITAEFQSSADTQYLTTGITLTANRPVLISIQTDRDGSATQTVTASGPSGNPLVWVTSTHATYNTLAAPRSRLTVFRTVPDTDSTGVLTFSMASAHNRASFIVTQFTDVVITSSGGGDTFINLDSTAVNSGGPSLTLDTVPTTGNATIGAIADDSTITLTAGDTLIASPAAGTTGKQHMQLWSVAADQTLNATTTANVDYAIIGFELVASSTGAGATVLRPRRLTLLGVV